MARVSHSDFRSWVDKSSGDDSIPSWSPGGCRHRLDRREVAKARIVTTLLADKAKRHLT
jgi:hypothetical protein